MKVIKKILLFILLMIFSPLLVGYAFFKSLKHFERKNITASDLENDKISFTVEADLEADFKSFTNEKSQVFFEVGEFKIIKVKEAKTSKTNKGKSDNENPFLKKINITNGK